MPAAPASLTGPAMGQLLAAAQALSSEPGRLLAVLAVVPDPRARRGGVRHRLAVNREPGAVRGTGRRPVIHGHRGMGRRRGSGHLGCVRRDRRRAAVRVHIPADPAEPGRGRPR